MELYANFTFDRAGQGLFYHGRIQSGNQSFSMVYDCGTSSQIKGASQNLSEVIRNEYNQKTFLGLLAISHFDFDHVSHIPELLKTCKVDTVMLPHIAKDLRAVFLAKAVSDGRDNDEYAQNNQKFSRDLAWLFRDPVGYFTEMGGARQVIGIQGDSGDDFSSDFNDKEEPIKQFNPNENEKREDHPSLRYVGGGRHLYWENGIRNKYSVYCGIPAYRVEINAFSWLFRPLNVQETLPQTFYDDATKILNRYKDDWWELLSDKHAINELTKLYDLYIGRGNRNAHSLLLRHEPEQYGGLISKKYRHKQCGCCGCIEHFHRQHCGSISATVLLGDLELDGKARAVLDTHGFLDYKTGVALIPHHGANSDDLLWLDRKISNCDGCATLVVSYGTKNRCFDKNDNPHPRFIYDGTIANLNNSIAFANEKNSYQYRVFYER